MTTDALEGAELARHEYLDRLWVEAVPDALERVAKGVAPDQAVRDAAEASRVYPLDLWPVFHHAAMSLAAEKKGSVSAPKRRGSTQKPQTIH